MIIKIFGSKYEGKSTVAQLIENVLKENNIEVKLEDAGEAPSMSLEERIKVIAGEDGPLKVEMKVIPYGRESRPNYATKYESSM